MPETLILKGNNATFRPITIRSAAMPQRFDPFADTYDQWYDAPEGKAIFQAELKCLDWPSAGRKAGWREEARHAG